MKNIVGVRFRKLGKIYFFNPQFLTLKKGELVIVDTLEVESLKTKDVKRLIVDLKLEGKVLFVTANDAEKLYLATRNLGYAAVIMANDINVYDLINADTVVMESAAVKYIEEVLK